MTEVLTDVLIYADGACRGNPGPGGWGVLLRAKGRERELRGGSFNNDPRYLRSAARFKYEADVRFFTNGFRVVREP